MKIEKMKELSFDELRSKYKQYMYGKGLSVATINTAYSDSFYIWKKGSKELFWQVVLSEHFEVDAKAKIMELLNKYSKTGPQVYLSNYLSHLRRFREFIMTYDCNMETNINNELSKHYQNRVKQEVEYEETIIIERMYAGGYLGDNIGHEIINTFKTDAGDNYIYKSMGDNQFKISEYQSCDIGTFNK